MIYKVSYVVLGGQHPGAIRSETLRPEAGSQIRLGQHTFEIVEVLSLLPPRDEIQYLHATLREVAAPAAPLRK
ncbi:MAG: hypothetical protein JNL34_13450 [Anaerolineae bacterium]|nr:hypothetical protein [Anaerolineae bacterium]